MNSQIRSAADPRLDAEAIGAVLDFPPIAAKQEATDVATARTDDVAVIIEQLHTLSLRQADRDRQAEQQTQLLSRMVDKLDTGKTVLPSYLMPILFTILLALLSFVYTTVDRRITENKSDGQQQYSESATEVRILRTYVIQLTQEMTRRGLQVPPLPETKR
jgi:hypothetical protein